MSRIDDLKDQERALYKARIELTLLESLLTDAVRDVERVDKKADERPYDEVRLAEGFVYDRWRGLKAACDERRHLIPQLEVELLKARAYEHFDDFVPGEVWKGVINE